MDLVIDGCTRGAERTALRLARALTSADWEHSVLAIRDSRREVPASSSVTVLSGSRRGVAPRTRSVVVATVRLLRTARSERPDLIIAHGATAAIVAVLAGRALGSRRPGVVWHRISPLNEGRGSVYGPLLRHGWRRLSAAVDGCVCITPEDVIQARALGASQVELIHNHRPAHEFAPPSDLASGSMSGKLFLFIGVLDSNKQPGHFIELARLRSRSHPDDRFALLGDGPLRAQLESEAGPGLVHFHGQVEDVRPALWSADALVVCSRSESATGAAIEAALAGLPVFTYPLHGLGEIAERSGGSVAAGRSPQDLADAIELSASMLGRDAEARASYARRCAETYDSDIALARYTSLFDRLIERMNGGN